MKNVLFIHQSAELYGSDKALLELILNLDKTKINPIVIIPNKGPLLFEFNKHNIEVYISPVIKLHRHVFTPKNLFKIIKDFLKSYKILSKLNSKYNFEIVYSNTLAVLAGYFFAFLKNKAHIWHVHEIIEKPVFVYKIYKFLLKSKVNSFIIFNSFATQSFWESKRHSNRINRKLIYNGLDPFKKTISINEANQFKQEICGSENCILIGLIGRINKNKGHEKIIEALSNIIVKYNNKITLLFVGTTSPNQDDYLKKLKQKIINLGLIDHIVFLPFQNDVEKIWSAVDIAVAPSLIPESFGLVALEAMLKKKPVIASRLGGLSEIVVDSETGYLINPFNVEELTNSLIKLIDDEKLRKQMGERGYDRAIEKFTVQKYVSKIEEILLTEIS